MKVDIYNTDKKYNIIYADPPWKYDDKGCQGAAEKIYPTMTVKEMATLPINSIANDDTFTMGWYEGQRDTLMAYRRYTPDNMFPDRVKDEILARKRADEYEV